MIIQINDNTDMMVNMGIWPYLSFGKKAHTCKILIFNLKKKYIHI